MRIILLAIILLAVAALASLPLTGLLLAPGTAVVTRVIDGDTIVLATGERVRLLGIDTPETGQHLAAEAKAFLRERVEGQRVTLEKDVSETDKYGRLLRYVRHGGQLVNLQLLREGYAAVLLIEPDTRYREAFLREEAAAREAGRGVWAFPAGDFCFGIFSFRPNARGNDNENLNDEYVTFRNKCTRSLPLEGWTVADASNISFRFPVFELAAKTTVTLHTGRGADNGTDLFWGRSRPVWNNNGDTLAAHDATGKEILHHTYP